VSQALLWLWQGAVREPRVRGTSAVADYKGLVLREHTEKTVRAPVNCSVCELTIAP
jgi:hypothetical protein